MTFLFSFHLAASAALTVLTSLFFGADAAFALAAGAGVTLLNLLILVFTWTRMFEKKLVALAIAAIILKFAIFGWMIYRIVLDKLFHLGWFSAGLGLVILSTMAAAMQFSLKQTGTLSKCEDDRQRG